MSSPGSPSSPSTDHISHYYYFVVAVVVVAVLLLASNMFIAGCCSRFSLLQSLKRFLRSRGLLSASNHGDSISQLIPATKYRNPATGTAADASECSVCLTPFVDGEEVRQLPGCRHSFHVPCIDMWLYSHSNCPNCRARVLPKGLRCPGASPAAVDGDRRGLTEAGGMTGSVVIVTVL